jgi:hypothetical protein
MNDRAVLWILAVIVWSTVLIELDTLRRRVDRWAQATGALARALQDMHDTARAKVGRDE